MSPEVLPTGPDLEAVIDQVRETYPHADVVTIDGAIFFSLDAEKHFPNFVTIVWIDDFDGDRVSKLTGRPGVFRINIGVGRETFAPSGRICPGSRPRRLRSVLPPSRVREAALDVHPQPDRRDVA